jgi:peptidoglycan/LPS O-acetylase OafA/YrhL
VVSTVTGVLLLDPDELMRFAGSAIAALPGVSNVFFWRGISYFNPDSRLDPLLMTWSLGVEEQFYLLAPCLLLAIHRFAPRAAFATILVVSILSLELCAVLTLRSTAAAFYLLPGRIWELGAGVLLAMARADRRRQPGGLRSFCLGAVGLLLLAASVTQFSEHTAFPGLAALVPCLGTVAMLAADGSFLNRRLLAAPPLVAIGRISYSWYLWHWPFMAFLRICLAQAPTTPQLLAAAALSLIPATLSWRFIEQPFRTSCRPPAQTCARYAAALAATAALPACLILAHGWPQRFSPALIRIQDAIGNDQAVCLANYGVSQIDLSPACLPRDGRPRVALLGDSHAAALGAGLRALADRHGFSLEQFTKSACPILIDATRALPERPGHAQDCATFNRAALAAVIGDPKVRSVILSAYWSSPFETPGDTYVDMREGGPHLTGRAAFQAALIRTEQALVTAGKKVFVLGDAPRFNFEPGRLEIGGQIPARRWLQALIEPSLRSLGDTASWPLVMRPGFAADPILQQSAASVPGVTYVNLSAPLCDASGCRFSEASTLLFVDSHHLTETGAEYVLKDFVDRL